MSASNKDMLSSLINRRILSTWYYLIQTDMPSGKSKVLVTVCNKRSIEEIKISLQKFMPEYIYSIDNANVYEVNRRCDVCTCSK